ncbi:MAG: hypothetical protein ACREMA_13060 [Longimicrobiales bacterium]
MRRQFMRCLPWSGPGPDSLSAEQPPELVDQFEGLARAEIVRIDGFKRFHKALSLMEHIRLQRWHRLSIRLPGFQ